MRRKTWPHWTVLPAFALLAPLACGGDDGPTAPPGGQAGPPAPSRITFSHPALTFSALGDSTRLTATVRDTSNNAIAGATVSWSSSDAAVATVNAAGWVVARGNGTARVVASSGALADTVPVEVAQVATAISPSLDSLRLAEGDTARLAAVVVDANGATIEGATVSWSSADPAVATTDADGLVTAVRAGGATTVTATSGSLSGEVAIAVLDQIAFERAGDLYVMNEDGTGPRRLTQGAGILRFWWAPSGNGFAYHVQQAGGGEVYVLPLAGGAATRPFDGTDSDESAPAWSPDGSRLAFTSDLDGGFDGIYVVDAAGGNPILLSSGGTVNTDAAWSPDGNRLAFTSNRDGNYEIYTMLADGSAPTRITTDAAVDRYPAWSPDGSRILFVRTLPAGEEIYVMDAAGGNVTRLTDTAGADRSPAWSPDGSKIVFVSQRDGNDEIYVMNADGTGQTNLSNAPGSDSNPEWSADGRRIAFVSDRDGTYDVLSIAVDGGTATNLTKSAEAEYRGAWRPKP